MTPKINDTRTNPETGIRERWNGQFWERIDDGSINEPSKKNKNPGTKPLVKEDSKPVTPNVTQTRETRTQIPRTTDPEPKSGLGKIIAVILVIAAIVGIVVAISSIPAPLGSAENPYLIYDGEDLQNIICGDDSVHYALANDIDLSGYPDWEPISSTETFLLWREVVYFEGTLDGRGHTITGLKCTSRNGGLFSQIRGTVKNLNVEDADVVGSGILAYFSYKATISDCNFSGTVTGSDGSIGGIVGENGRESTIIRSSFTGTVSGTDTGYNSYTRIGGIAGKNGGIISDSVFKGTLCSSDGTAFYTGGIAGSVYYCGVIKDCSVSGSISGDYYVGGIAGWVDGGKVINCKSSGSVQVAYLGSNKFAVVSGVVALLEGSKDNIGTVQDCTSTAYVSAEWDNIYLPPPFTGETGHIVARTGDYAKVI